MNQNYFFVDGSALLSDIARLQTARYGTNRLHLNRVVWACHRNEQFRQYHSGHFRRFTYYFVKDENRLDAAVVIPDHKKPGEVVDLRIESCGKRVRDLEDPREWLDANNAPPHVRERLHRAEKAVDTQICCDALQLAARNKLDRLFLYTNDSDFVPLCKTLRSLGININLFLLDTGRVNEDLAKECDAFTVLQQYLLDECFDHTPPPEPAPALPPPALAWPPETGS